MVGCAIGISDVAIFYSIRGQAEYEEIENRKSHVLQGHRIRQDIFLSIIMQL